MNNWKKCKLGDIGKVITGKTPSAKNPEDWGNDMCFITPTDYKDYRKIASSSIRKLSNIGIERLKNKILPPKSIMVTCIGSDMGKVAVNKNPSITNQQINSIIPYEKVADADFVYYLLVSMYDTLRTYGLDGTAVPILNKSDFETIEILLPPLEEQRQIAAILSSIDDKIELLHEQNKTLEELAQTLFRHYFIENSNPSWQEKPLSEIAKFLNGLACQKYPPKNFLDKLPVLKIKELSDGAIGKNPDYASSEIADDYIVNSGDVIFSWSATLMVKIWGGEKSVLNQHLFKVSSDKYPKWFFYYWTKYHLREFITISQAHATTMGHIKRKDLDNAMCKIPKDEYLKKCDLEISPKIQQIENNLNQIRTLENMRDILIPKLLNGEIKVGGNQ